MRYAKPWKRKQDGKYYVQVNGQKVCLGTERKAAYEKYHALMDKKQGLLPGAAASTIIDRFLTHCERHNAPATYTWYKRYLDDFKASIGRLKLRDLKPLHVTDWMAGHEWDVTSRSCAVRAVKRPFQWAADEGYIAASPIKSVKRIKAKTREKVITPEEWTRVIEATKDARFKDFLTFIRETGCRPQEARFVEARHFREEIGAFVIAGEEAPKGDRTRTIYLTDKALELVRGLVAKHPTGKLLRNKQGTEWKKEAIVGRFKRLRTKLNIPGLVAYATRHTFGTELLMNGVDSIVGAELMGHADTTMLASTYAHLAKNTKFLREAQRRARGETTDVPTSDTLGSQSA